MSCAVGLAVLDVIKNEKLLSSAKCVGMMLLEGFRNIQARHPMMGDVRWVYVEGCNQGASGTSRPDTP